MKYPSITYLHVNDLNVDYSYQRQTDLTRAKKIANSFKMELFRPLSVSKRTDGTSWVWDGGHRLAALKMMGEKTAPCIVFELSYLQEANTFGEAQGCGKGLSAFDKFRAQIAIQDPKTLAIVDVLNKRSLVIAPGSGSNRIACVKKIYSLHDSGTLVRVCDILIELGWLEKPKGKDSNIFGGLGRFLSCAGDQLNYDRLVGVLAPLHPGGFLAPFGAGHRYDYGVSLHIADVYNKGIKIQSKKIDAS